MKSLIVSICASLLMIALASLGGYAQATSTQAGRLDLGVYTGTTFDLQGATAHDFGCNVLNTTTGACTSGIFVVDAPGRKLLPLAGGTLGVSLTNWLSVTGDYSYVFENSNQTGPTRFGPLLSTVNVSRSYWIAGGRVEISRPTVTRAVPFLTAGFGSVHESYEYRNITNAANNAGAISPAFPSVCARPSNGQIICDRNIATPSAGGGVRLYLTERTGLRFAAEAMYLTRPTIDLAGGITDSSGRPIQGFVLQRRHGFGRLTIGYFIRR